MLNWLIKKIVEKAVELTVHQSKTRLKKIIQAKIDSLEREIKQQNNTYKKEIEEKNDETLKEINERLTLHEKHLIKQKKQIQTIITYLTEKDKARSEEQAVNIPEKSDSESNSKTVKQSATKYDSIRTRTSNESLVTAAYKLKNYYPRTLLTQTESAFFQVLCNACQNQGFYILVKTGLWALARHDEKDKNAFNMIAKKQLDFIICDQKTLTPLLVVELDDHYHNQYIRQVKDADKDFVLKKIGIPVLRIVVSEAYNVEELKQLIESKRNKIPNRSTDHK